MMNKVYWIVPLFIAGGISFASALETGEPMPLFAGAVALVAIAVVAASGNR